MPNLQTVRTALLDIAVETSGPADGRPAVLLHGFPYDPRAFDAALAPLHADGVRTIVPYLRGYGPTRFLSPETPRSGQQAAIGADLKDLLDAMNIERAVLAGFDWGARAACIVAALWPERVHGLVTCGGYQIQDIATSTRPVDPEQEERFWYQYYFHTERGRAGLEKNRAELCNLLWQRWSPTWKFDDSSYAASAVSFDNPDFVDVVIHSYRHRMGNAAGDARYDEIEARLAALPVITVPSIVLHGDAEGVAPTATSASQAKFFKGRDERRVLADVGHNPAAEAAGKFARAVLDLLV